MECIQSIINALSNLTGLKAIPALCGDIETKKGAVVLDVPSFSQTDDYSCGAIAAWSIVETFHRTANFERFYDVVDPRPGEGAGPQRIVAALRRFKVNTRTRRRLKLDDLKAAIDAGMPMLIGTGKEHREWTGDHWSTIYGYDKNGVYLGNNPGVRRNQIRVGWSEFLHDWWNPRGVAIVCSRM